MLTTIDNRFAVDAGAVTAVYWKTERHLRSTSHAALIRVDLGSGIGNDVVVKTHDQPALAESNAVAVADLLRAAGADLLRVSGRLFVARGSVREIHACGVCGKGAYVLLRQRCGGEHRLEQPEPPQFVPLNAMFNAALAKANGFLR